MDMTIDDFCDIHLACEDGHKWAKVYESLRDAWDHGDSPKYIVWASTRPGVLTERELRLFACFCARQNWHLLADPRSKTAVEVAERHASGTATDAEMAEAAEAAAEAAEAAAEAAWSEQAAWLWKNTSPNFSKE